MNNYPTATNNLAAFAICFVAGVLTGATALIAWRANRALKAKLAEAQKNAGTGAAV